MDVTEVLLFPYALSLKPAARSRRSTRAFFAAYLRPHRAELVVAVVLTLLLGMVAAPIPVLLGPALQVIADPEAARLRLENLYGPFAGSWVVRWSGRETVSAAELLAVLSIAVTVIVKSVVSAMQWFSSERLGERIALGMRRDLIDDYLRLDPAARRGKERH